MFAPSSDLHSTPSLPFDVGWLPTLAELHDHLGDIRLADEQDSPSQIDGVREAITTALGLHRLARVGIVAFGGTGKAIAAFLYALALRDGIELSILVLDDDHRAPDRVLLPNGDDVGLPEDAFFRLGVEHARNAIKDWPLLRARYIDGGLFRGIDVFESYPRAGHGASGYPVIAAADIDLSIEKLYPRLLRFLGEATAPEAVDGGDLYAHLALGNEQAAPERPSIILFVGGGCGAMGPGGHLLLPGLVRFIVTQRLHRPVPYQVGVVCGPRIFRGFHGRTGVNWLTTLQQFEHQRRQGITWEFINNVQIDDATPPYDRACLFDAEPTGDKASEADVKVFAGRVAMALHLALTSDLLERVEALTIEDRRSPWTTLRTSVGQLNWDAVAPAVAAARGAGALAHIAAPVT